MALEVGSRLDHDEVTALIGESGMGRLIRWMGCCSEPKQTVDLDDEAPVLEFGEARR